MPVSDHQIKRLLKFGHIGSWDLDLVSGRLEWSDEACRICGVDPGNNVHDYKVWEALIHPEDLGKAHAAYERSKTGFQNYELEHRIVLPNGAVRTIFLHVEYVFDEQRQPIGLSGVIHDLTDMVSLKNELLQSAQNIRLMMDLIPISIYARDAEGYYIFANHVFLKHYGITYDELQGKHLRDFVRSDAEFEILWEQDQTVLRTNERLFVPDFRQTDHAGNLKVWRIIKVPFTPEGSANKAVLGVAEDITEHAIYQDNLRRVADALADRNRSLEQYSQMVSHELRGPIATLMGVAEVVNTIKLTQDEVVFFCQGIQSALAKLDHVIRKMNDILGKEAPAGQSGT